MAPCKNSEVPRYLPEQLREMKRGSLQDGRGSSVSFDRVLPEEEQAVIAYALKHPQVGYRRLACLPDAGEDDGR